MKISWSKSNYDDLLRQINNLPFCFEKEVKETQAFGFHDGSLYGLAEYQGETVWFKYLEEAIVVKVDYGPDDEDLELVRVYALYPLTEEEITEIKRDEFSFLFHYDERPENGQLGDPKYDVWYDLFEKKKQRLDIDVSSKQSIAWYVAAQELEAPLIEFLHRKSSELAKNDAEVT